jgi:uncharacterized protein (TIRG00374 family)
LKSRGKLALRIGLSTLLISFVFTLIPWRDRVQAPGSDHWITGSILEPLGAEAATFVIQQGEVLPEAWESDWADSIRATGQASVGVTGDDSVVERGLISVLHSLRMGTLLAVLAAALGGLLCGITRWWGLLKLCGAPTGFGTATRLTLLGLFFNLVLPGLTGGDVIKAAVAAKEHPGQRPAAVMAVGLDRVLGLWVLLWIGAISSLIVGGDLLVVAVPLSALAGLSTAGLFVLCSPGLRAFFGSKRLVSYFPESLNGVVDSLRNVTSSPAKIGIAIGLSLGNHLCVGLGVFVVARGVGDAVGLLGCLTASVVANSISAIPIAPGGWGVGEAAYAAMFKLLGSSESVGYAVSLATRLCMTLISLLSGFAIWRGGGMSDWLKSARAE